jgi:hypothetical protein
MIPAELAKELLLMLKDSFKAGRQLEQSINSLPNTLKQLQGLMSQVQQGQQQVQQLSQENQQLQQEVAKTDQAKQQTEQARLMLDAKKTDGDHMIQAVNAQNSTAKTQADVQSAAVNDAVKIAGVHQAAQNGADKAAQRPLQ